MTITTAVREADEILRELLVPEPGADPYLLYQRLREVAPVHRSDLDGVWYLSSYEACKQAMLDPAIGKPAGGFVTGRFGVNQEQVRRFNERRRPSMIISNPPEHTRLRAPARGPFMPGRMERLRPWIEEILERRLDVVAAKGEADVMADIALKLPVEVIGELVGVPPADRDEFPPLVDDFFEAIGSGASEEKMDRADRAVDRFIDYFDGLIDEGRVHPRDDLIGHLLSATGDAALEHDELHGTITLVFVAGFITTSNLICNGLLAMFRSPGEMARLWADPGLVPTAVEEMLRHDSPVQLVERAALEDTEIGGQAVAAGENVVPLLGAANRDPHRFADPDRLDLGRPDGNGHVSFAWGLHHCLGAPLARLEGRIVFARLRERFARLELLDPDPPHRPGLFFRSLTELPVRFISP